MLPHLTVSAISTSRALCKVADVKTRLGISGSSYDAQLAAHVLAIGDILSGPEGLGREPWLQTYVERTRGEGGVYLYLSRWPVMTVTSVTEGTGDSPTTITASDYSIAGRLRNRLWKATHWARHVGAELGYTATYTAGYVMPDQVTTWSAAESVTAAGLWYSSTDTDHPLIFRSGGAGTTDSAEPTWPTAIGGTVVDNDITWTAYEQRLPALVEEMAIILVSQLYGGGWDVPAGIEGEKFESMAISYREQAASLIPASFRWSLANT